MGRGPAPGVPLGGLPQVILEAHLPGFAATPEAPQAVGSAPQKAPALPGECGQVVHAASGQGPGRPTASTAAAASGCAPARPCDPTRGRWLRAPHRRRGGGGGFPSLARGRTIRKLCIGGSRSWQKFLKSYSCCFQTPSQAKLSL